MQPVFRSGLRPLLALAFASALLFMAPGAKAQDSAAVAPPAHTGTNQLSDVRLFSSWAVDAAFTPGVDLEPAFQYSFYDSGELWFGGARTAFWVSERTEFGGRFGWTGFSPDEGSSESGFADLELYGKYRVPLDMEGTVAAGAELQLPTGSADAGQDNTIVRIFGAIRRDMAEGFTFTANLGFEYLEYLGDDRTGISLGAGTLIPMTETVTTVFEFGLRTAIEYAIFIGGMDYELPPGGHLRGAVGIGLDEEAPNVELQLSLNLPIC